MRKFLISLLLAGAAASPVMAAPSDSDRENARAERHEARAERQEARSERQEARSERQEARSERQQQRSDARSERPERAAEFRGGSNDGPSRPQFKMVRGDSGTVRPARDMVRDSPDSVRNWRGANRQRVASPEIVEQPHAAPGVKIVEPPSESVRDRRALRQSERPLPNVLRNRVPVVSSVPREGTQPPLRAERRRTDEARWSTSHWRHDRRYDWHNWRSRHRSLFRLGFYVDPFGWGYRPYSIGWRLWPSYYSSRFWLNDPWQYRLPYAPPGYRWVRYYDDALLVDTWNGEVVDVIYNFFW